MNEIDYAHLDGRLLQLLVAIVEEGSVTRAALRMGVSQSAVSHLIGKLRAIVGDPLMVKSGRGIVTTVRAQQLAVQARELLESMRRFAITDDFNPASLRTTFTIAANDFQRDLLLPPLMKRLHEQAPGVSLRVLSSGVPSADMLREGQCQLIISPRPPDGTDVLQKRLFEDQYRVFYDHTQREAPRSLQEYLDADHITVLYEPRRSLDVDNSLAAAGVHRRFAVFVPGFVAIRPFLSGTTMLATVPGLLRTTMMSGLRDCSLPTHSDTLPMYMIWHLRYRHDPVHTWLRLQLESVVPEALKELPAI